MKRIKENKGGEKKMKIKKNMNKNVKNNKQLF